MSILDKISGAVPEFAFVDSRHYFPFDNWYDALPALYDLAILAAKNGNQSLVNKIYDFVESNIDTDDAFVIEMIEPMCNSLDAVETQVLIKALGQESKEYFEGILRSRKTKS